MKTLLITGTTGFIGKNILTYIRENFKDKFNIVLLSSCDNTEYKTVLHNNYTFNTDTFLHQGIKKIDIVLHIGAFIPKSGAEGNDIDKSNSNIINTKYLLDNLPNIPDKFIFLSTIDVYGKNDNVIDEKCIPKPLSMYGWSKLYCEKLIEEWALMNDAICQILRVGHIYGKGEEAYKKIIPVSIKKIKNGESPQIFGRGNEKRSFLHVDDACRFIIASISLDKYEGVINLCSAFAYSIKEIIEMLIKISNQNFNIEFIPSNHKSIDFNFDIRKMNELLGTEKITIEEGLRDEYS